MKAGLLEALRRGPDGSTHGYVLKGGKAILPGSREAKGADIFITADGFVGAVGARLPTPVQAAVIDIAGLLISPGFIDAHQHLDKTGTLKFAPNPSGTLQGARDAFAAYARRAPPGDVTARASRTMRRCLARGTTAIRSHVNVDKDAGFSGLEQLCRLRSLWAYRRVLRLVAFMISHPNQYLDWLESNIDAAVAQADAVGGTPAVAEDPDRYLDILFKAAARHGRPV